MVKIIYMASLLSIVENSIHFSFLEKFYNYQNWLK